MKISIASKEIIHFIGIGGIGMSGLAQIMKNMGFNIQGSDLNQNRNTDRLANTKIKVYFNHNKENLKKATMIVISSAIKNNNKELRAAKKKNLPIFKRGEMLANIVSLKKNIVIAGSHGKTTTTSLVANILLSANLDPTVINGGVINSFKNTAKLGQGEWAVIESDESDGSFLQLPVTYSIITNLDKEHLDFYGSYKGLENSFCSFIKKTPTFGKSIICLDDKNLKRLLFSCKTSNYLTYGFDKKSNYQIANVRKSNNYSIFDIKIGLLDEKNKIIKNIKLNLIGDHNISNAAAAIVIALNLGIKINRIKKALQKFMGIQRRFTKVFSLQKKEFYDDYAHHPTEIKALIKSARQVNRNRNIISVFQPHRYSRVHMLKNDFASSFKECDTVILCPVYAAGEKIKLGFNYNNFARDIIKNSKVKLFLINDQYDLAKFVKSNIFGKKIVIGMGAGTISAWMRQLPKIL